LRNVNVTALVPKSVDRSLPSSFPQTTPILVVLVTLMMLHAKLVKSTLSPELVKTRQQRRYHERHPDRVQPPLVRYYTLSLDTSRTQIAGGTGKGGWEQAWHRVRGFLRHYKSGKIVAVRSHSRGNPLKGVINKDYDVRGPR
jgi:hypothetical protein